MLKQLNTLYNGKPILLIQSSDKIQDLMQNQSTNYRFYNT